MKWNSDKIVSLSAMSISLITLVIFIYQTNLMSKQNYLSILPYLSLSISSSPVDGTFKLRLENHGVGPAIIESAMCTFENKKYDLSEFDDELFTFLRAKAPELDSIKAISHSSLEKGMAIPIGASYGLIEVNDSSSDFILLSSTLTRLIEEGLRYEVIYRSIQDERWLINNDTQGPKKLN